MHKTTSRFGGLFLLTIVSVVAVGCVGLGVPVDEEVDVAMYYDEPRGWYVDGYWAGGCLNCGVWVAPFWTRDVVVLHQHWGHYHGPHYVYLEKHFSRYGGHGHYNHRNYQQRLERQHERRQREQRRHELNQQREGERQKRQYQHEQQREHRQQQRFENRREQQEHRQKQREQRQERQEHRQERRHKKKQHRG